MNLEGSVEFSNENIKVPNWNEWISWNFKSFKMGLLVDPIPNSHKNCMADSKENN